MYGKDVKFKIGLLKFEDKETIQSFSCDNDVLDRYIKNEIFDEASLNTSDGLHFKVYINDTKEIIGFFSLASSGITVQQENYSRTLSAVRIDVFAIDTKYQRLHWDEDSKNSVNPDEHLYFSDMIMAEVLKHCRDVDSSKMLIDYVILYAAKSKLRFYERNLFKSFNDFMIPDKNMEVNNSIPMYMAI